MEERAYPRKRIIPRFPQGRGSRNGQVAGHRARKRAHAGIPAGSRSSGAFQGDATAFDLTPIAGVC